MSLLVSLLIWLQLKNCVYAKEAEIRVWSREKEEFSKKEWGRNEERGHFWVRLSDKEKAARVALLKASECRYGTPFGPEPLRPGMPPPQQDPDEYPRLMSIQVPQCATKNGPPKFSKFCSANIHCTNNFANFTILEIVCAAISDNECPDAKSCALAVDLEMERPSGDGKSMIIERFPMRGSGQEVWTK